MSNANPEFNTSQVGQQVGEQVGNLAENASAQAEALAAQAEALLKEKIEKAKAAAEKLKALKDKLKKKKSAPPKLAPVQKVEPKPLPQEQMVKFKDAPAPAPAPEPPLDRNGYTYIVKTVGPKNQIIVYSGTKEIYRGVPSFTATVDILLKEALVVLSDANDGNQRSYPNIRNLIRKVDK